MTSLTIELPEIPTIQQVEITDDTLSADLAPPWIGDETRQNYTL